LTPWRPKEKGTAQRDPLRLGDFFLMTSEEQKYKYPHIVERFGIEDTEPAE
jgi:hypothetical protein